MNNVISCIFLGITTGNVFCHFQIWSSFHYLLFVKLMLKCFPSIFHWKVQLKNCWFGQRKVNISLNKLWEASHLISVFPSIIGRCLPASDGGNVRTLKSRRGWPGNSILLTSTGPCCMTPVLVGGGLPYDWWRTGPGREAVNQNTVIDQSHATPPWGTGLQTSYLSNTK